MRSDAVVIHDDISLFEAVMSVCNLKTKRVSDTNGRPFFLLIGKDKVRGTFNSGSYQCDAIAKFDANGGFMFASVTVGGYYSGLNEGALIEARP